MELSDGLRVILKGHLGWGKCLLVCFPGMLLSGMKLDSGELLILAGNQLTKASTKNKHLYTPRIYLPVSWLDDLRSARQWKHELARRRHQFFSIHDYMGKLCHRRSSQKGLGEFCRIRTT